MTATTDSVAVPWRTDNPNAYTWEIGDVTQRSVQTGYWIEGIQNVTTPNHVQNGYPTSGPQGVPPGTPASPEDLADPELSRIGGSSTQ